ncbi:MAG: zf-TFIIB domain-containing protein [Planctomycetes bacterium]|nr:zf-TFIIB domain-containing protein [Planctomycetota bacterium]
MTDPPLPCPKCASPLRRFDDHGVAVDVCDADGIWFDRSELRAWARARGYGDRVSDDVDDPQPTATLRCPHCRDSALEGRSAGGVRLARCSRCAGIWVGTVSLAKLDPDYPQSGRWLEAGVEVLRALAYCLYPL